MRYLIQALAFLWASPYTLAGLLLGGLGLCTGGRARICGRIVEFYGRGIKWLIHRFPDGQLVLAFTQTWSPLSLLSGTHDSALAREPKAFWSRPH